jgi:hypothetical protein
MADGDSATRVCVGVHAQHPAFPLSLTVTHQGSSIRIGVVHGHQVRLKMAVVPFDFAVDHLFGHSASPPATSTLSPPSLDSSTSTYSLADIHTRCVSILPSLGRHGLTPWCTMCRFQAVEYDGKFFVNPGSATGAWTGLSEAYVEHYLSTFTSAHSSLMFPDRTSRRPRSRSWTSRDQ